MAKLEDVKPISNGYDFGDDWLDSLEEALDFDSDTPSWSEKPTEAAPAEPEPAAPAEPEPAAPEDAEPVESHASPLDDFDIDLEMNADASAAETTSDLSLELGMEAEETPTLDIDLGQAVSAPDSLDIDVGLDAPEPEPHAHDFKAGYITAQSLDISELQKQALAVEHTDAAVNTDPFEDEQLWQFVSLILTRLFDDLELILIQQRTTEACDLMKQLSRLMNILAFAGLSEQLPILTYIANMLPITFTDNEIGMETERRFDAKKMRGFLDRSGEFLNCLTYLLDYISHKTRHFRASRFASSLSTLYGKLGIDVGKPSQDAPLAVTGDNNPHELTTRTVNKLARTLETIVTESLHYVESAVFYGYASGYEDAAKGLNNAAQIAREYKLADLEDGFIRLHTMIKGLRLPNRPGPLFHEVCQEVCDSLDSHFGPSLSERKIRHVRSLVAKFCESGERQTDVPFCNRWKTFIKSASPLLDLERLNRSILRERIKQFLELAETSDVGWLKQTFHDLDMRWENYPESCSEALLTLIGELRAFPTEDIEETDLEQLDSESLRTLLARTPDTPPQQPYATATSALHLSLDLPEMLEHPASIPAVRIYDLLIDARENRCHALVRIYELLLCLLDRVPRGENQAAVADSVVTALYFASGLMQAICDRLLQHLEQNPNSPALTSSHFFFQVLLSLYQTPGQPRDGVTWFIVKRLNSILSELELVWVNTSTPTSTEYYCTLIRNLLHLSTICEMRDVRQMLLTHLDDIPAQDFVNTENRLMSRQCTRIIRAIEDACPKLASQACSPQVMLFFSKTIAAINQLVSSQDMNSVDSLRSEISRIETRMSMLGMTTDFPPVISLLHELHHLAYQDSLCAGDVEDFLYHLINLANNVCPEWVQPREAELEFVKTYVPLPMPLFQELIDSIGVIYESLQDRAKDEPVAWERVSTLHKDIHSLIHYLPYTLQCISYNAQNRCRYLKKNIYIDMNTSGYPTESELPAESMRPVLHIVFTTVIHMLLELLIDNAFTLTDYTSRITVVLHPFTNEYSASIFHNGKLFTCDEISERLSRVNIMPAQDENVFDLLVGSKRLALSYPPVNALAYILPMVRQFGGVLDITDEGAKGTRIHLSFKY